MLKHHKSDAQPAYPTYREPNRKLTNKKNKK